jgi:hypothetical protein
MKKRAVFWILGMLLLGSMACNSIPFLAPTATPTATLTPTVTYTPTPTATFTPSPTRTRTPSPTKIIGIEEPVKIGRAMLQFRQALRRNEFRCGDQTDPVENPDIQEYLVLVADVISGPVITKDQEMRDWVKDNQIQLLAVVDNNENYSDFINLCYAINSSTNTLTRVTVAFLVDMAAKSFVLILPDDIEIPLDRLM